MSSFTMPLLEEGVDVELPVDLAGIIGIMDEEVRTFTHKGHGYALCPRQGHPWQPVGLPGQVFRSQ